MSNEWSSEWPKVDGQYWVRVPEDRSFDEVVEIEGDLAWAQGQIDPYKANILADYEFLGPITPADTERVGRLEAAARERIAAIDEYHINPAVASRRCGLADDALRAALAADTQEVGDGE